MPEPTTKPERFAIVVEVRPQRNMPAIAILKRFLKVALRGFGVRCREIRQVSDDSGKGN
jgi:hypothetical protein